jgi:hypothetical protein
MLSYPSMVYTNCVTKHKFQRIPHSLSVTQVHSGNKIIVDFVIIEVTNQKFQLDFKSFIYFLNRK